MGRITFCRGERRSGIESVFATSHPRAAPDLLANQPPAIPYRNKVAVVQFKFRLPTKLLKSLQWVFSVYVRHFGHSAPNHPPFIRRSAPRRALHLLPTEILLVSSGPQAQRRSGEVHLPAINCSISFSVRGSRRLSSSQPASVIRMSSSIRTPIFSSGR